MTIHKKGPDNSVSPKFKVPPYSTDTATPSTGGISSLTTPDINIEIAVEEKPVAIGQSEVASPVIKNTTAAIPTFSSNLEAALYFFNLGFKVIPTVPTDKRTVVSWDEWLKNLSVQKITKHWSMHPEHELGFIVGDEFIVFDADSPESIAALKAIEQVHGVKPNMVVTTTKGEHHYFRRAKGTFAKSDSHSTKEYPDRLDVKTGRALIILPPSTGKTLVVCDAKNASELTEVNQDFIDAVFQHNGRPAPRPPEITASASNGSDSSGNDLARLIALLKHIDPDCGYEDWLHVLMAVYHETGGSEDGFNIANDWSSMGKGYEGEKDIRTKWNSFKSGAANPITIATIVKMAKDNGADLSTIYAASGEQFEPCVTEVVHPTATQFSVPIVVENLVMVNIDKQNDAVNPLDKYSLHGKLADLEKMAVESVYVLNGIALLGQATALYAWPNTGKSLLFLYLLIDSIKSGRIDPSKVYLLNMDDTHQGLIEKLRLAEEYGFKLLAEGYEEFSANQFIHLMLEMIENDSAHGVIVALDTLKKFTDVMDKSKSTGFAKVVRKFVMKGGTVIALAHANKKPGADGKPIPGGTSDIKDDFDCAYTIAQVTAADGTKVVEFENVKRRGNVAVTAAYSYSTERGISYEQLLASVQPVDEAELDTLNHAEAIKSDGEVIAAIKACITDGVNTKMKLADVTAKRADISRRAALQVMERYTGTDPNLHHWSINKGARGAMLYALLATSYPEVEQELPEATLELLDDNQPVSDTVVDGSYDAPTETIPDSLASEPASHQARTSAPLVKVGGIWCAGPSGHHPAPAPIEPPEGT